MQQIQNKRINDNNLFLIFGEKKTNLKWNEMRGEKELKVCMAYRNNDEMICDEIHQFNNLKQKQ